MVLVPGKTSKEVLTGSRAWSSLCHDVEKDASAGKEKERLRRVHSNLAWGVLVRLFVLPKYNGAVPDRAVEADVYSCFAKHSVPQTRPF